MLVAVVVVDVDLKALVVKARQYINLIGHQIDLEYNIQKTIAGKTYQPLVGHKNAVKLPVIFPYLILSDEVLLELCEHPIRI